MKLIATLAVAIIAMASLVAEAATVQYKISNSPSDALTQHGGLSGHKIFAGIEGTFAITYEPGAAPVLSELNLHLVNVTENFDLLHFNIADLEGAPIQDFMSHDLTGSAAFDHLPGFFVHFATPVHPAPPFTIITAPYSSLRLDRPDDQPTLYLGSMLTSLATMDGPLVHFKPLTATLVPEPTTIALAGAAMLSVIALRRRK